MVVAVDRLFRDTTGVSSAQFVDDCRKSQVTVITEWCTYTFHDPVVGSMHRKMFRFEAESAADYIEHFIKGRLAPGRRAKRNDGYWTGGTVATGFLLDKNNRYVPFKPYQEILLQWWMLFVFEYNGNLRQTVKHIQRENLTLPNPDSDKIQSQIPDDCRLVLHPNLYRTENGDISVSPSGLKWMLSNCVYAGHWISGGVVTVYNNHEPLIPQDLWQRAFDMVSEVNLDGTPNENYKERKTYRSYNEETLRNVERPLFEGLLYSQDPSTGKWRGVGVYWNAERSWYGYYFSYRQDTIQDTLWRRSADLIDTQLKRLLKDKLTERDLSEVMTLSEQAENHKHLLETMLANLHKERELTLRKIERLTNANAVSTLDKKLNALDIEEKRICKELAAIAEVEKQQVKAAEIQGEIAWYGENYLVLSPSQLRDVVNVLVKQVEITCDDELGELTCMIHWLDGSVDGIAIGLDEKAWLRRDIERLIALANSGATQIEIMSALPTRNWNQISGKYRQITGQGLIQGGSNSPQLAAKLCIKRTIPRSLLRVCFIPV